MKILKECKYFLNCFTNNTGFILSKCLHILVFRNKEKEHLNWIIIKGNYRLNYLSLFEILIFQFFFLNAMYKYYIRRLNVENSVMIYF